LVEYQFAGDSEGHGVPTMLEVSGPANDGSPMSVNIRAKAECLNTRGQTAPLRGVVVSTGLLFTR
jgi:hypothetical protein